MTVSPVSCLLVMLYFTDAMLGVVDGERVDNVEMVDDSNNLLSERRRLKSLEKLQVEVSGFCSCAEGIDCTPRLCTKVKICSTEN
jgi:hypothetical protein